MQTVTVPRSEYEAFQQWRKNVRIHLDESWFWTPEWQKKEAQADEDIRKGKISGPFSSHEALMRDLKGRKSKK